MKYLILIISILPLYSFSLSSFYSNGEFKYKVWNSHVSARLDFPFHFYGLDLSVNKNFYFLKLQIKIHAVNTTSKDEDIKKSSNKILAYSENNNKLKDFFNIQIGYKKFFICKLGYERYLFDWFNSLYSNKSILNYDVRNLYGKLGISKTLKNLNIELALIPSYIKTKDTHILRNFYVKQRFFIYGYYGKISYKILKKIKIFWEFKYLKKAETDMSFYDINGNKYLQLPSSFEYYKYSIGLIYIF